MGYSWRTMFQCWNKLNWKNCIKVFWWDFKPPSDLFFCFYLLITKPSCLETCQNEFWNFYAFVSSTKVYYDNRLHFLFVWSHLTASPQLCCCSASMSALWHIIYIKTQSSRVWGAAGTSTSTLQCCFPLVSIKTTILFLRINISNSQITY